MYLEFTVLQTMEHFLTAHENAFRAFAGVPKSLMVDNLKSAVLQRPLAEAPVFNPRYLDLARHFGFTIKPCGIGKGNEKAWTSDYLL
jgi:transposase